MDLVSFHHQMFSVFINKKSITNTSTFKNWGYPLSVYLNHLPSPPTMRQHLLEGNQDLGYGAGPRGHGGEEAQKEIRSHLSSLSTLMGSTLPPPNVSELMHSMTTERTDLEQKKRPGTFLACFE